MNTIVRLDHVTRHFGHTPAAVDVSFAVDQGEVFGLLGHNGAGKTTLIRLINGLLVPDAGQIAVFGLDPAADGHAIRRRSGVLTTYPGLDDYLSAAENLAVYAAIHGLDTRVASRLAAQLLARLGLDPRSQEPVRGLSAGLKQRVALARALIHDPELLLLDEPTANLDPVAAREVRDLVTDLAAEGRTVIFSSHNLAEAESLCDRIAILREGNLLASGSVGQLAVRGRLRHGVDLRVGTGQGPQAMACLRHLLNGHPLREHGDRITVEDVDHDTVAGLVHALVDADLDVYEAVPRKPSLEDVYMALHQPEVPA